MSQPRDHITKVRHESRILEIVEKHTTPKAHDNPRKTYMNIKNDLLEEGLLEYHDNEVLAKTLFAQKLIETPELEEHELRLTEK